MTITLAYLFLIMIQPWQNAYASDYNFDFKTTYGEEKFLTLPGFKNDITRQTTSQFSVGYQTSKDFKFRFGHTKLKTNGPSLSLESFELGPEFNLKPWGSFEKKMVFTFGFSSANFKENFTSQYLQNLRGSLSFNRKINFSKNKWMNTFSKKLSNNLSNNLSWFWESYFVYYHPNPESAISPWTSLGINFGLRYSWGFSRTKKKANSSTKNSDDYLSQAKLPEDAVDEKSTLNDKQADLDTNQLPEKMTLDPEQSLISPKLSSDQKPNEKLISQEDSTTANQRIKNENEKNQSIAQKSSAENLNKKKKKEVEKNKTFFKKGLKNLSKRSQDLLKFQVGSIGPNDPFTGFEIRYTFDAKKISRQDKEHIKLLREIDLNFPDSKKFLLLPCAKSDSSCEAETKKYFKNFDQDADWVLQLPVKPGSDFRIELQWPP